jgi:hypothetical protein
LDFRQQSGLSFSKRIYTCLNILENLAELWEVRQELALLVPLDNLQNIAVGCYALRYVVQCDIERGFYLDPIEVLIHDNVTFIVIAKLFCAFDTCIQ